MQFVPSIPLPYHTIRCLALAALLSPTGQSAVYYVSPTGTDSNAGSASSPWRTVQRAADVLGPGDTAIVSAGSYPEWVRTTTDGTPSAPIGFQVEGKVVIGGFRLNHSNIIIDGFEADGTGALNYEGAITLTKRANSVRVANITITNSLAAGVYGIWITPGDYSSLTPTNIVFDRLHIANTARDAVVLYGKDIVLGNSLIANINRRDAIRVLASDVLISANVITNVSNVPNDSRYHVDIIQTFATNGEFSKNVIFERNLVVNCTNAQLAMMSESEPNWDHIQNWSFRNNVFANVDWVAHIYTRATSFYNNLFYRCGNNSSHPLLYRAGSTASGGRNFGHDGSAINNIFVECGSSPSSPSYGWYYIESGVTGFTADHNLVIGSGAGTIKGSKWTELNGINGQDPQFRDPEALDFTPSPNSPLIGAGKSLSHLFSVDLHGNQRGPAWDIGPIQITTSDRPTIVKGFHVQVVAQ
jgi:hypothetical protein